MSNMNDFACFADRAERGEELVYSNNIYTCKNNQLTVGELLRILQDIVKDNPEALDGAICHVEYGGLTKSTTVEITYDGIVISGNN